MSLYKQYVKKKNQNGDTLDFTEGDTTKLILKFYWPLLLSSMFQQLYTFVDTLIVGKGLGDYAFAAVGNMSTLFFLIVGFSLGIANGFGIIIAQNFGAKNYEMLRRNIAATIQLSIVIAFLLTGLSLVFLPDALVFLRTDELIMKDSLIYGYIIFGGVSCSIAYNVSSCILRSLGDSRTPLKSIVISSVINLILDALFIFVFHSGVEGAAIATLLSQVISSVICIKKLCSIESIKLKRSHFKNEMSVYLLLFKNGLPMALMNSVTAVGCMVVQYFVNGYGVDYTSAYSACSRYINLFMNPAFAAGGTMSAYTSQNYGAGKYERIREGLKVCLTIALVSYLLFGTIMYFMPYQLAEILLDGEVPIMLAVEYLPVCGLMLICVDCLFVYRSGVQGMGYQFMPMFSGVLEMIMRIAIISMFMGKIGFCATAYAEAGAWLVALLVNMSVFYYVLIFDKNITCTFIMPVVKFKRL